MLISWTKKQLEVGSTDGLVCAEANEINGYYYFKPSGKCDIKIKMYTLASLIREYDVEEGSILKMDCEGCEYDIILNDYNRLSIFKELLFEYHACNVGISVSRLLKKLAKDYNCYVVVKKGKGFGLIHCLRRVSD